MIDKKQIFLSYGRGDDQALVEEIATKINKDTAKTGFSAWYDKFNLPSATQFTNEIAKAIEDSKYLVFFIGNHSLNSEWCEREWKHALKQCVPIIPVSVNMGWDDKRVKALPKQINRKNGTIADSMTVDELVEWIIKQVGYDYTITQPLGIGTFPKHFVERPQYVDTIKTQLRVGDRTDIGETNVVGITAQSEMGALRGMSGIGKSTLAKAVCYDCEVQMTYDHIFFLEVNQSHKLIEHELEATAMSLFRLLGFWLRDKTEEIEAYKQLQTARGRIQDLLRGKRTLIVLDDVWRKDIINLFTWEKVHLLITTRNRELIPSAQLVNTLTLEEGEQLFRLLFVISKRVPTDIIDDHRAILTFLDGHTLAIEIAGKWLIKYHTKKSPADYLAMLQSSEAELFKYLDMRDSDIDRNDKLERSIALSYTMLASDDDRVRFRALGIFAPNATFSLEALNSLWSLSDGFLEASALSEVGLLEEDKTTRRYNQHPLLRAYALKLLTETGENEAVFGRYADFYIQRAEQIFEDTPIENWDDNTEGSPNAHDITNIKALGAELMRQTHNGTLGDLARALEFAYATMRYVNYRMVAKAWAWTVMGIAAAGGLLKITPDDTDLKKRYSTLLNNLGNVYRAIGKMNEALAYYEEALAIARALGDRYGEATTLNNIGEVYQDIGEMNEALAKYEQALPILRAVGDRGGEATMLNNMGSVYYAIGEMNEALAKYEQALTIFSAVRAYPYVATSQVNIATLLDQMGRLDEAIGRAGEAVMLMREKGLSHDGAGRTFAEIEQIYISLKRKRGG